jgi:hypothetical protein
MANHKTPGPLGRNSYKVTIDENTLCRASSPQPGPVDAISQHTLFHTTLVAFAGKVWMKEFWEDAGRTVVRSVQARIDSITQKAKKGEQLSWTDRQFLKLLYSEIVRRARERGYPEAASLMERYLEANKKLLQIPSDIYENSPRVQKEMSRQRKQIRTDIKDGKLGKMERTSELIFAEQDNPRLKYANNRFYLKSMANLAGKKLKIIWGVNDFYDFESFEKSNKYSAFEAYGEKITIPDGLSEYLTHIDLAAAFPYESEWQEEWDLDEFHSKMPKKIFPK